MLNNSMYLEGHIILDGTCGEILLHQATSHSRLEEVREAIRDWV